MTRKRYLPEEIISQLCVAEILMDQGFTEPEAIEAIGVSDATYHRWRIEYGCPSLFQARRVKDLEKENQRLRKVVTDLTLDKLLLMHGCKGAV